jgi:hypothetical protein
LTGRTGELGHAAHFTRITQGSALTSRRQEPDGGAHPRDGKNRGRQGAAACRSDDDTGQTFSLAAVNPSEDPFWVIPVVDGKLNNRGFYVASLDYMNKNR